MVSLGMADAVKIVVLAGDQTGQELLEQAVRLLDPGLLGLDLELERFDLSLENRRATANEVVTDSARAIREAGLGLKAATITPEGADDVGSPNRILREEVDGKVIVRTGRRLPGVPPIAGVHYPMDSECGNFAAAKCIEKLNALPPTSRFKTLVKEAAKELKDLP